MISRASMYLFNLRCIHIKSGVIVLLFMSPHRSSAHLFAQMFARTPPYPHITHIHNRYTCKFCVCVLYVRVCAMEQCVVLTTVVIITKFDSAENIRNFVVDNVFV